jgi:hypothetical protein
LTSQFCSRPPSRYYAVVTPIRARSARVDTDPAPSNRSPFGILMKRFFDMLQNRYGIVFRYFGLNAALAGRRSATMLTIARK